MSSLDQLSELKKWKKRKGPVDKERTESNIRKGIKINGKNIKRELDMALNKKSYKSSDGKVYGPSHYAKAALKDMEWQTEAKKKLKNKEKISAFKKAKEKALSIKDKLPTTYKKASLKKK